MLRQSVIIGMALSAIAFADLTPIVYQLPEIDANAKPPFSYTQSTTLGNQVIISDSQITRSGATDIGQLLNNIAGIQYVSGLGMAPQILIHTEPALIMVDGQSLTNFSMSDPDIGLIPLSEIAEIIITPGVAGAVYGNQSLGGVINIITKSPRKAEQEITLIMGAPLMTQMTMVASGPIDTENAYRINAQNEYDQGSRDSDQESSNQAGLKLQHDTAINSLQFSVYGLRQITHYPGYLTASQVAENPNQSIVDQGQGDETSNTGLASVAWKHTFNNAWASSSQFSYRQQAAQSNLEGPYDQDYQTIRVNPELNGSFMGWKRQIHTQAGILLSNETYGFTSPDLYSNINNANQQQYSGYGSLDVPLVNKISLTTSGRVVGIDTHAQFYNNDSSQFNPPSSQTQQLSLMSLSLNDQFNAQTSGYLRRAMGYQLPFIDESNYTSSPNTGFGLKATTSTAYETGINWHDSQWQTAAEVFVINLNNEIGFYTPPNGLSANYNLAPTRREGFDVNAQYEPTAKWTLRVSTTVMNNRFREGAYTGNDIPGASAILGDFSARYQLTSIWSIYGESHYTGSQYAEGDNTNNSASVPSYCLLDLALNAEFPSWVLSFRIDNLANTEYNLASVYISSPPDSFVAYYPAAGRTAMLQIRYKLS
ncbi:MAG: TonB-dependent receptor [Gammaproteobacteria bacterium]|nr:TonB-dependent receptor [Gammaproteobacteria bacterium]